MRSFHTEASAHDQSRPLASAPCIAAFGTAGASLTLYLDSDFTHPPSYLPSLGAALLSAPVAIAAGRGTMKALTPAPVHFKSRSPRLMRHTFLPFRPQPRGAPDHRFVHHFSVTDSFQTSP
jgi:hypothetical protein